MKKIVLMLCVLILACSFIGCGSAKSSKTDFIENISLGETTYKDIQKSYPELAENYNDATKRFSQEYMVFMYYPYPSTKGKYVLNDVEGRMDLSYSKDNVLVFAEFCNYETDDETIEKVKEWLEKKYSEYTKVVDTNNTIVWTNGKMDVTFFLEAGKYSNVQWKLCDFEWKFDE